MHATLSNFHVIRPAHEIDQEQILTWVAAAHAESSKDASIGSTVLAQLKRIGLGKGKIGQRGVSVKDCLHYNWDEMEIYKASHQKEGLGLGARMALFDRVATDILTQFYPDGSPLPSHLVHVTCTGYAAPSPAQKVVALRKGGRTTTVTHAYHMGCYAAIPAIRIAQGEADVVHTELCCLHMNPSLHSMDQLVVQSLFGDGFIKYSLSQEGRAGLKVLATQEEVLPDSTEVMKWACDDWGMKMTLSKDIPLMIAKALPEFVVSLLQKASVKGDESLYFAIHPGGPKIIEQIAVLMRLEPWQFLHST